LVIIIALKWFIITTSFSATIIHSTSIGIIARSFTVDTSRDRIARVIGTLIVIITISIIMIATRSRITIINSTGIIIITRNLFSYTTNIRLTAFVVTSISETSDEVISTSNDRITIVMMTHVSS